MKKIIKHWIHFFLKKMKQRMIYVDKELTEEKKSKIINRFHAVGFGFVLDGNAWNFKHSEKIIFGNNIHIGNNAYFNAEGGLVVGDNTHFSHNVTVLTATYNHEGGALPIDFQKKEKSVCIGKNVWIGENASITAGVTIGDGAVIGVGAIVNRDVTPHEIVESPGFVKVNKRSHKHYMLLESKRQYAGINGTVLDESAIEQFLPSYLEQREKKIVFILSTGRSGSTSIVDMLNQHPDCKAFHEDIRQLIRISTQLAYFPEDKEAFIAEIKDIFSVKPWQASADQILVHSDQRLWNLIPFLKDYFPNSKFIHLKREPVPSVLSMIARGWYAPHEFPKVNDFDWSKFRLQGDRLNMYSKQEWDEFTNIQKCAWYYQFINESIQRDVQDNLSEDRFLTLHIESILSDSAKINKFLGISNFNYSLVKSNKRKKAHDSAFSALNNENVQEKVLTSLQFFQKS